MKALSNLPLSHDPPSVCSYEYMRTKTRSLHQAIEVFSYFLLFFFTPSIPIDNTYKNKLVLDEVVGIVISRIKNFMESKKHEFFIVHGSLGWTFPFPNHDKIRQTPCLSVNIFTLFS